MILGFRVSGFIAEVEVEKGNANLRHTWLNGLGFWVKYTTPMCFNPCIWLLNMYMDYLVVTLEIVLVLQVYVQDTSGDKQPAGDKVAYGINWVCCWGKWTSHFFHFMKSEDQFVEVLNFGIRWAD